MVTIIGLGTSAGELSLRAANRLKGAQCILVRAASLPSAEVLRELGLPFESLECVYERSRNFDTLAKNLAAEVKRRAAEGDVVYCTDGGVSEDRAAQILIKQGAEVLEGVTKAASAAARAHLFGGYTAVSAYEISDRKLALPLIVYDLDDKLLAGDVKLLLADKFGDEAPALLLNEEGERKIALYEADRAEKYTPETALVVFEIPLLEKKRFDLDDFITVMRRLRAPDGCPWDRVQTHESIRINLIEEAYELVDAIDRKDSARMQEEAGDVLMQAVFHTLMEEEQGNFNMTDVLSEVTEKLITRHTHVFGQDKAAGADGALSVWEKNKMTEKHQETFSDAVNDVPEVFPALLRAQKIAKRTEKGGFQDSFEGAKSDLLASLEALSAAEGRDADTALADLLYAAVRLGRKKGVECEQALLDKVKAVQREYTAFESLVLADGKDVNALSDEERDAYRKRAEDV